MIKQSLLIKPHRHADIRSSGNRYIVAVNIRVVDFQKGKEV